MSSPAPKRPAPSLLEDGRDDSGVVPRLARLRQLAAKQPERIVFCIDVSTEGTAAMMRSGSNFADGEPSRMEVFRCFLKRFVYLKYQTRPDTEFAICLLQEQAVWHMDFVSNQLELVHMAIDEIAPTGYYGQLDSNAFLELLFQHAAPDRLTRAICLITRCARPSVPSDATVDRLRFSNVVVDVVYLHDRESEEFKPQDVYDRLTEWENPQFQGWFFETARVTKKMSIAFMKLLANPAVRYRQEEAMFTMPVYDPL